MMAVIALGGRHDHIDWAHASTFDWIMLWVIVALGLVIVGLLVRLVVQLLKGQGPFGDGE